MRTNWVTTRIPKFEAEAEALIENNVSIELHLKKLEVRMKHFILKKVFMKNIKYRTNENKRTEYAHVFIFFERECDFCLSILWLFNVLIVKHFAFRHFFNV